MKRTLAPPDVSMPMQKTMPSVSPFLTFSRAEWARFRAGTPLSLSEEELLTLQGLNDPVSLSEVEDIYLPLSRLLSLYQETSHALFEATQTFLNVNQKKVPFIIGVAGSVAVGKSTFSRIVRVLLSRWPQSPNVALLTTDGFLFPNKVLQEKGLLMRKGFPESYDTASLVKTLDEMKSGKPSVSLPTYSHHFYDVLSEKITLDAPDILIVEGLNVLQTRPLLKEDGQAVPMVSDYFDFKIFLDAEEHLLEHWYIHRFMMLRKTAFQDKNSYFHRYASFSEAEARSMAKTIWSEVNLINLRENILPTRPRADLILKKGENHSIEDVSLRKV